MAPTGRQQGQSSTYKPAAKRKRTSQSDSCTEHTPTRRTRSQLCPIIENGDDTVGGAEPIGRAVCLDNGDRSSPESSRRGNLRAQTHTSNASPPRELCDSPTGLSADEDEEHERFSARQDSIQTLDTAVDSSLPAVQRSRLDNVRPEPIEQYRPPKRPRPVNTQRSLTPVPGATPKKALGNRLRQAADRVTAYGFSYNPIRAEEVRLLKLEKGGPNDKIKVGLMTVSFQLLGKDFIFEALSYHWGDDMAAQPIYIRDLTAPRAKIASMYQGVDHVRRKEIWVKYNLFKALYHLRDPKQDLWLWVDALCINQDDSKEKEIQVARIADVYISAKSVIIWLGESDKHTGRAVKLLLDLADPKKLDDIIEDKSRLSEWKDLAHLMKSTWFSRRWVIQELALASDAVVYCGSDCIHWNDLRDGIDLFVENEERIRAKFHRSKVFQHDYHALEDPEPLAAKILVEKVGDVFRKNARPGTFVANQSLEVLISSLFAFDTSDPRDTINGLINISKEGIGLTDRYKATTDKRSQSMRQATLILDETQQENRRIARILHLGRNPPPKPSYLKDVLDVYVEFLQWIVESTGSINILCRHWAIPERTSQNNGYPELVRLPTWIKLTTDGPFKHTAQVWCRQNADSLVGLPDESPYNACDSRTKADIKFNIHAASKLVTKGPIPMDFRKTASAKVRGLRIGHVCRCTDAMSGGNISMNALDMLGWKSGHSHHADELKDDIWRPLVVERGLDGKNPPSLWRKSCMEILNNHTDNQSINIDMILPKVDKPHTKNFLKRMRQVTWNRKFMELKLDDVYKTAACTDHAAIGLGQPETREGDIVCILYGCTVPCMLRPRPNHSGTGLDYDFVGECYVYGFMGGEAITMLEANELKEQETYFTLH